MRKWLTILLALIIFLVVVAITGVWQFNRVLNAAAIKNLHYQIESVGLNGANFSALSFAYDHETYPQSVELRNAQLKWEWQGFIPHVRNVNIDELIIKASPSHKISTLPQELNSSYSLPDDWHFPSYIPSQVNIRNLLWEHDCAEERRDISARCVISAQIDMTSKKRDQLIFNLKANPGGSIDPKHQLLFNANYVVENNLPTLNIKLSSEAGIDLQLSTRLLKTTEIYWAGDVAGIVGKLDEVWLQQLGLENQKNIQSFNGKGLTLSGKWNIAMTSLLLVPKNSEAYQYAKALSGNLFVEINMAEGFQVPVLGKIAGKTLIDVETAQGQIKRYSLLADLSTESLTIPESLKIDIPPIAKARFKVESNEDKNVSLAALPIKISMNTEGSVSGNISGNFIVDIFSKKIITDGLVINAKLRELRVDQDYGFKNTGIDVKAIGYWQPESFSFNVNKPSYILSDVSVKSLGVLAKATRINTNSLVVSGNASNGSIVLPDLLMESEGSVSINKLSHDQLKENSWSWQGKVHGKLNELLIGGALKVGSSLDVTHEISIASSILSAKWKFADIYLLAANPFSDTLKAWPPLLSLARGKLNGRGTLEYNVKNKSLVKSETTLDLQELAGIYDTAAFEGFSTKLSATTKNKTLKLESDKLQISQINKGFIFGPLQAKASYEASWEKPLQGKLVLTSLSGQVAQGTVSTPAQHFDFSKSNQHLILNLKQINLTNLLQQYPTSELSGSGLISGSIPLEISKAGIRITKGAVAAEEPGGKLKYASAKAAELAKSQPSMKLLTEALNDFQYSILSSDVNYDESGKLILSVRLEGKNPSFEKGRPIHFNINFEEDIPAMLASIQLSSRVNDIIKKRLQEYLQNRPHTGDVSIKR